MPDYVIAIDAIGPCWVNDLNTEGDPGRTFRLEFATRYTFHNAEKRATELLFEYPHRRLQLTITELGS